MPAKRRFLYRPSVTLLAVAVLAAYYQFAFRPLVAHVKSTGPGLVALWDRLATATRISDACAGLDLASLPERRAELQRQTTNLAGIETLVRRQLVLPTNVVDLMQQPFLLIDFQNERQRAAEAAFRLGHDQGVLFEPGSTNGLPEYFIDMIEPGLLWARLHAANQLLLTALHCKVATVRALNQLPTVSHRTAADGMTFLEELPMRVQLVGSMDSVGRFLASLPLTGSNLAAVGLAGPLTNKPALFPDHLLLKKYAPANTNEVPRTGDVILETTVSLFVPSTDATRPLSP